MGAYLNNSIFLKDDFHFLLRTSKETYSNLFFVLSYKKTETKSSNPLYFALFVNIKVRNFWFAYLYL